MAKADLSTVKGKLAELTSSLESTNTDLAKQSKQAAQLQSNVQQAQDKVAEARADAYAAQSSLQTAEEKISELTDSLDSAKVSHDQAVGELQQRHAEELQVDLLSLSARTSRLLEPFGLAC